MASYIRLYNREGHALSHSLPLVSVVQTAMEAILEDNLTGTQINIVVYPVYLNPVLHGNPIIRNLSWQYGYARVSVSKNEKIIYQHPHTIEELISKPLQNLLRKAEPDGTYWGFYLDMPGVAPPPLSVQPLDQVYVNNTRKTPEVEGSALIAPYGENEKPAFGFQRIPDAPLPKVSLDDFEIISFSHDHRAFVKVLLHERLFEELNKNRDFSRELEEGGFLIGLAYEDSDNEGTYLLELTHAIEAEHTGASLLHFTYTGDSFSSFKQTLRREHPQERLLGWYHTHLFPATDAMGLSSIDLQLHYTTFRQPWQLAGLINMDSSDFRTIRFYVRQADLMIPCPQWIIR